MGSQAKKEAYDMWKAGVSLSVIQFAMLFGYGTSKTTVKKWVLRWNQQPERKKKLPLPLEVDIIS